MRAISNRARAAVEAGSAREALDMANDMIDRGLEEVEIIGADNIACDFAELQRITDQGEND